VAILARSPLRSRCPIFSPLLHSDLHSAHMLCVRDYELACASKNQQTTAALTCRQILASEQIHGYITPTLSPLQPPTKLTGFASISGTASGKSGVDMFTPVHPLATPLGAVPLWGRGSCVISNTMWPGPRSTHTAKFHLNPSSRLVTIHQSHRQDRQTDRTGQGQDDGLIA